MLYILAKLIKIKFWILIFHISSILNLQFCFCENQSISQTCNRSNTKTDIEAQYVGSCNKEVTKDKMKNYISELYRSDAAKIALQNTFFAGLNYGKFIEKKKLENFFSAMIT